MRTLFSSGKAHGLCVWPGGTSYRVNFLWAKAFHSYITDELYNR